MKIEEFNSDVWEQGFKYKYFVPAFINHPFSWEDDAISALLEKASLKLGELNSSIFIFPPHNSIIPPKVK